MNMTMWREARNVFDQVAVLPDQDQVGKVDELCGDQPDLAEKVLALLNAYETTRDQSGAPMMDMMDQIHQETYLDRSCGPYRLTEVIGHGGMGSVFLGERKDGELEQKVAVKFLHTWRNPDLTRRFLQEGQTLANLKHPNICRLLDVNRTEEGTPYLVMEYIQGTDLLTWCDEKRLTIRERIGLFLEVCDAVSHAHQALIIHRDIKSSNILVDGEGWPKLVDFGIAKHIDTTSMGETTTRHRVFSPPYASPEQFLGRPLTVRVDVYGLGLLLYELLSGLYPYYFERLNPTTIEEAILHQTPPAPGRRHRKKPGVFNGSFNLQTALRNRRLASAGALEKQLDGDLDAIVMKALEPEAERRYDQVDALAQDLRKYLMGMPVSARQAGPGYRFGKFFRRHRLPLGLALTSMILLLSFTLVTWFQARKIAVEKDNALVQTQYAREMNRFLAGMFKQADFITADPITDVNLLLERGADKIEEEFQGQPLLKASLMTTVGGIFSNNGNFEKGRAYLERAMVHFNGEDTPDRFEAMLGLAYIDLVEGKVDQAHNRVLETLKELQRSRPDSHRQVIRGKSTLVQILYRQGRLGEMEVQAEDLLETYERIGEYSDQWALMLNELAVVYQITGKLEASRKPLEDSMMMYREMHGPDTPLLAPPLQNMAFLHSDLGQYEEAVDYLQQSLDLRLQHWPPESPFVLESQLMLAGFLEAKGDREAAGKMYHLIQMKVDAHIAPTHFLQANVLSRLGRFYLRGGDLTRSREYLEANLTQNLNTLGPDNDTVGFARRFLGMQAAAERNHQSAVSHFREALRLHISHLGEIHNHTGINHVLLGKALISSGRLEEGWTEVERGMTVLEACETRLMPVDAAWIEGNIGYGLLSRGRAQEARPFLERSHKALCRLLGAEGLTREVAQWLETCHTQLDGSKK